MASVMRLAAHLCVLLCTLSSVAGLPSGNADFQVHQYVGTNVSHPFAELDLSFVKKQVAKVALRILPLGASIMSGVGSSTGNGYVTVGFDWT